MDAEYVLNRLRLEPAPLVGRDIGRLIVNGNPEDLEAIVVRLVDLQYQNNTYGQALYEIQFDIKGLRAEADFLKEKIAGCTPTMHARPQRSFS
jgi:hypothetical protein